MKSARRRSRELALQGLYEWIYTQVSEAQVLQDLSELEGYDKADHAFLEALLRGAMGASDALRAQLEPLADRKWDEVSPVERAILLIGAWELNHLPSVPYRVTINEAIELAKRFGGTDGHKYVNGVLDRLASGVRADEVARPRAPGTRARQGSARRPPRAAGKKATV